MGKNNPTEIFIVEDNKVFSKALKEGIETAFKGRTIRIHSFETGEDCMKRFADVKPQIVILDYNLNGTNVNAANGITVLDWIKKENGETNVIMLTSNDHIDIALKALKHGACDYVVKTETKFTKINHSLLNLFKMIEAVRETRKYKLLAAGLIFCVVLLVGGVVAIQIFDPSLLR